MTLIAPTAATPSKDSDGLGEVHLDGIKLEGGVRSRGQRFTSADGKTIYEMQDDGSLSVNGLTIQDFKNGDLGIHLREQDQQPATDVRSRESTRTDREMSESPSPLSQLAQRVLNSNRAELDQMGRDIVNSPLGEQFRQRGAELREEQQAQQRQQEQEAREQTQQQAQEQAQQHIRRGPVMRL